MPQFTVKQKLDIMHFLETHTYFEAYTQFGIKCSIETFKRNVQRWKKNRNDYEVLRQDGNVNTRKRCRLDGAGCKAHYPEEEKKVADFARRERRNGRRFTIKQVCKHCFVFMKRGKIV